MQSTEPSAIPQMRGFWLTVIPKHAGHLTKVAPAWNNIFASILDSYQNCGLYEYVPMRRRIKETVGIYTLSYIKYEL